jgi:hypothetical protein
MASKASWKLKCFEDLLLGSNILTLNSSALSISIEYSTKWSSANTGATKHASDKFCKLSLNLLGCKITIPFYIHPKL